MAAPRKHSITDDDFRQLVAECLSVAQVLGQLGLVPAGGNYKTVRARIQKLEIDTTHFTGSSWNQGGRYRPLGNYPTLAERLVEGVYYQSFKLKRRLIKQGLLPAAVRVAASRPGSVK